MNGIQVIVPKGVVPHPCIYGDQSQASHIEVNIIKTKNNILYKFRILIEPSLKKLEGLLQGRKEMQNRRSCSNRG